MSIIDNIISSLSSANVQKISQEIGASPEATNSAVQQALPILLGALSKNTSAQSGWSLLSSFLDKDHDGGVMDDLFGMVFGGNESTNTSMASQGAAALNQMLGSQKSSVEEHLKSTTGLSMESITKLLPMLAPLVVGSLAKAQKTQNLDQGSLSKLLEVESEKAAANAPQAQSFLSSLLDANKDGSVLDDVVKMGANLFGGTKS